MRVLLIRHDLGRRKNNKALYPLELAFLATALAKRHVVRVFDPNLHSLSIANIKLMDAIHSFSPEVVGISIKYFDTTIKVSRTYLYRNLISSQNFGVSS